MSPIWLFYKATLYVPNVKLVYPLSITNIEPYPQIFDPLPNFIDVYVVQAPMSSQAIPLLKSDTNSFTSILISRFMLSLREVMTHPGNEDKTTTSGAFPSMPVFVHPNVTSQGDSFLVASMGGTLDHDALWLNGASRPSDEHTSDETGQEIEDLNPLDGETDNAQIA